MQCNTYWRHMRRHLSPCKRLSPLTTCRCSKHDDGEHLISFPGKHGKAQPDPGVCKGWELHVFHPHLLPKTRLHPIFSLTFSVQGWVRAPQGWLLAVQGHVDQVQGIIPSDEDVPQVVKLESCLFQGRHCEYLPPCYKSSCLQLFSPFPLISIDPNRPEQPPAIALIPLPSACSCLILY